MTNCGIKDDDKISLEKDNISHTQQPLVVSVAVYSIQPVIQYTSVLHKNKVPDQSMARVDQFHLAIHLLLRLNNKVTMPSS
jgi:hypothetical protein